MNNNLEELTENPEVLLDLLDKTIDIFLEKENQSEDQHTFNTQLIEISKTIERLEKLGVSVPDSLRSEKIRLLEALSSTSSDKQKLIMIQNRVVAISAKLLSFIKNDNQIKQPNKQKPHNIQVKDRKHKYTTIGSLDMGLLLPEYTDKLTDFSFMRVKRVFVVDTWHIVNSWTEVRKHVYNRIITERPNCKLDGILCYSKNRTDFRTPIVLTNGLFTEGNLSASRTVELCRESMKVAGYSLAEHFHLEIEHKHKPK